MGKSYKKSPYCGIASDSDKNDKREANRKMRRKLKERISVLEFEELEEEVTPHIKEFSDVWCFSKDGKMYLGDVPNKEKYLRK